MMCFQSVECTASVEIMRPTQLKWAMILTANRRFFSRRMPITSTHLGVFHIHHTVPMCTTKLRCTLRSKPVVPTLLWADLTNVYIWTVLIITLGYGMIGFMDDYKKLKYKNSKGISAKGKLFWQFLICGVVMGILLWGTELSFNSVLYFPFVSTEKFSLALPLGLYFLFSMIVIVGTSNAVNLTDGLDGLAIGPVIVAAGTFLILAYSAGTVLRYVELVDGVRTIHAFDIAEYLKIPKLPGISELAIFCGTIVGAGVGFLWFNTFPASVFMGDVGALSLGGALGTLAVLTKSELLSVIIFGIFLLEIISVITQTTSYKLTGKRVFKMAPIHHHYELKGWAEPKIIVRFWIISGMLAMVAIASLKLR